MKAWMLHGIGDLSLEECPVPKMGTDEAVVAIKAAGICGSDIPRIYQTGAHIHPIIPGHEFSGVVVESSEQSWLGRRVCVFPLIPCGKCDQCKRQKYELCQNYNYLGSRCDGGFAEYVKVPVWNLIELPENTSFELAALLEPLSVAIHAVRRANVSIEDRVAVIGLGPIGLFCTAVLHLLGVKDLAAIGNKESQREMLCQIGLSEEVYSDDIMKSVSQADIVFECVGCQETVSAALHAAPEGRIVLVGNPNGVITLKKEDYWKILRNQLKIFGTWNSSFYHDESDDWNSAIRLLSCAPETFYPVITHRLPLEALDFGLNIMRNKTESYGKVMMVCK